MPKDKIYKEVVTQPSAYDFRTEKSVSINNVIDMYRPIAIYSVDSEGIIIEKIYDYRNEKETKL